MGARKRKMAESQKEIRKQTAYAKLNNVPTSPRKMRLVADLVRGVEVNRALDILKYTKNEPAIRLQKLLKSAIANWEGKNEGERKELESGNVIVKSITVDSGRILKRIQTKKKKKTESIRKSPNHVTKILNKKP